SNDNWSKGATAPHRSLPPAPASAATFDRDFHLIAAPHARRAINLEKSTSLRAAQKTALMFSYQFDADSGEPLISQPGFVAAYQLMGRMQACRLPGTSANPMDSFRAGQAVLGIATLSDLPRLQAEGSLVRDKFGICRIPGSSEVFDLSARKVVAADDSE